MPTGPARTAEPDTARPDAEMSVEALSSSAVTGSGALPPTEDQPGRAPDEAGDDRFPAGDDGSVSSDGSDAGLTAEDRRQRLREAAYQAELRTGRRERTRTEAKRNIIVRLALIAVGGVVFLTGLAMLVLPGPGILVSLVGLGILAREFTWADQLMRTLREKSHVDEVGRLPIWAQVALGLVSIAALIASVVWVIWLR